jgi:hypothetical protein
MSPAPTIVAAFRFAAAIAVAMLALSRLCSADDCWQPFGREGAQMLGSRSCASTSCHGRDDGGPHVSPRGREFAVWLAHDPHARAAQTIQSPRFREILDGVIGEQGAEFRREMELRCAVCHDPVGFEAAKHGVERSKHAVGFTCESCHGAAEHWIAAHYERDITRERLSELGMVDTKNLLARGRQCASCHVGDGECDMNHDMIAAGHPPLRFELSAYHDLIRRKHWTDAERTAMPYFKAQLWVAGQVAVTDATLALLESRAHIAATSGRSDNIAATSGRALWPEFSEYDCFACHQRLRTVKAPTSGRSDLKSGMARASDVSLRSEIAGIPGWQPWNLALAQPLVGGEHLAGLRKHLGISLFVDPSETKTLAAEARRQLHEHPLVAAQCAGEPNAFAAQQIIALVQSQAKPSQSWASSGQQLLALQAAYLAWRDAYLAERDEHRMLMPPVRTVSHVPGSRFPVAIDESDERMQRQMARLGSALRFGSADFEWPALDWKGLAPLEQPPELADAAAVARQLDALAESLHQRLMDRP